MAKFRIFSDLHLEMVEKGIWVPPYVECDGVLLCGDIGVGSQGIIWARKVFPDVPVAYVFGNHEWYGKRFPKHLDRFTELAKNLEIDLLERTEINIAGVRILGATMWTDFALNGNEILARLDAGQAMNDYNKIVWNTPGSPSYRKMRPEDVLKEHFVSRNWLEEKLSNDYDGKTVVITHHAPCIMSLDNQFPSSLDPCYASRLEERFFGPKVALWAHGHTHKPVDYSLYGTRVVSNPKGYPFEPANEFNPSLIIEV